MIVRLKKSEICPERIQSSGAKPEFLLKKDYEKQIGGILTAGQTVEYRVLKKKQQEDMKNRMKEEIEAIKREQSRM